MAYNSLPANSKVKYVLAATWRWSTFTQMTRVNYGCVVDNTIIVIIVSVAIFDPWRQFSCWENLLKCRYRYFHLQTLFTGYTLKPH